MKWAPLLLLAEDAKHLLGSKCSAKDIGFRHDPCPVWVTRALEHFLDEDDAEELQRYPAVTEPTPYDSEEISSSSEDSEEISSSSED